MILGAGGLVAQMSCGKPVAAAVPGLKGLDWNGDPAGRRMLYWSSPLAQVPATYLFKVYQRNQVTRTPNDRYYTTFFWGNNGTFFWDGGSYVYSYYGAHPYPVTAPSGDGKWEISALGNDFVTRDSGTSPYVTNDAWYSQAFYAKNTGGNNHEFKFYINLPGVTTSDTITKTDTNARVTPPTPALMFGQAPDNGSNLSWGGYVDWEEQNAIIRGIQVYSSVLTESQIVALAAKEHDSDVLAYCAAQSITSLWYLNMNPTPTDVTDKSGAGHHPSWAGTERPTEYSA